MNIFLDTTISTLRGKPKVTVYLELWAVPLLCPLPHYLNCLATRSSLIEREYWIEKTMFLDYWLKVNLDKIKINKPFPMGSSFCFGLSYTSIALLSVSVDALLFKKRFLSKILMWSIIKNSPLHFNGNCLHSGVFNEHYLLPK